MLVDTTHLTETSLIEPKQIQSTKLFYFYSLKLWSLREENDSCLAEALDFFDN